MNYAIIRLKGKQYLLKPGGRVTVSGEVGEPEKEITEGKTLLVSDGEVKIGTPELDLQPRFKVIEHKKGPKIKVATYKAKSRYRRHIGHRQMETVLELVSVGEKAKKSVAKAKPKSATAKKPAEAKKAPVKKTAAK